jgi:hypothetical protein
LDGNHKRRPISIFSSDLFREVPAPEELNSLNLRAVIRSNR